MRQIYIKEFIWEKNLEAAICDTETTTMIQCRLRLTINESLGQGYF